MILRILVFDMKIRDLDACRVDEVFDSRMNWPQLGVGQGRRSVREDVVENSKSRR